MTTFFQEQREVLSATQALRRQLLNVLGDVDLGFRPADGCLSLAEVCREMGRFSTPTWNRFAPSGTGTEPATASGLDARTVTSSAPPPTAVSAPACRARATW